MKHFIFKEEKIAYREAGSTDRPALFFVHGNSLSSATWKEQFEDSGITDNFHCFALDLPGHGESSRKVSLYDLDNLKEIVIEFINEFGSMGSVAVGHSLGGHLLLESAEKLALDGMLIFGTPPLGFPPDPNALFLPDPALQFIYSENLSDQQAQQLAEAYVSGENQVSMLKESILHTDGLFRAALGASVMMGHLEDEVKIVQNLEIPLGVLHGKEEKLVNLEYIQKLDMPTLWQEKVIIIDHSSHSPQLESPVIFNHHLIDFARYSLQK